MIELYSRYVSLCEETGKLAGISFELTNFCNFSCKHCYRLHGNTFMEPEIFYKALHEAEALGAIMVSFNGGEPTLHPHFLEFALHVLNRGMHISILTNGSGLSDSMLEPLSPWCKGLHFQFSLYGVNNGTGSEITGVPESFETAFSRILNIQRRGFDLRVALLLNAETADGVPALITRLRSFDVNIGLMPQLSVLENGNKATLQLCATDDQIIRLLPFEGIWTTEPNEPTTVQRAPDLHTVACSAGVTSLGIRADGSILPCQVFTAPILGHVSTDSLESILHGQARTQFLAANVIPDKCSACDLISNCMRCPADAMFETGELTGIPPESCRIARLRAKMHVDSK